MRLERGLSGKRSAETIIAESGSPGGELYDAIVSLRTSESCHYCPQLQTQPGGHSRGTRDPRTAGIGRFSHIPSRNHHLSLPSSPGRFPLAEPRPPLTWAPDCIVACRHRPPEPRAMRGVIEHPGRAPQRAAWRLGLTASLNRLHPHTASALPWCKGRRHREVLLQRSHPQPRAATPIPARAEPRAGSPGKPGKPGLPPAASAR